MYTIKVKISEKLYSALRSIFDSSDEFTILEEHVDLEDAKTEFQKTLSDHESGIVQSYSLEELEAKLQAVIDEYEN